MDVKTDTQKRIVVHTLPNVLLTGSDTSGYCQYDQAVFLKGLPPGGRYIGPFVDSLTGFFDPASYTEGKYTVYYTFTDDNGCSNLDSAEISIKPQPEVLLSQLDPVYCIDHGKVEVNAEPAGGVFGGVFVYGNEFDPGKLSPGGPHMLTYTVEENGCFASDTQEFFIQQFWVDAGKDDTIYLTEAVTFDPDWSTSAGDKNDLEFDWMPFDGLDCPDCIRPIASPYHTTTYTLTVSDPESGCVAADKKIVVVLDNDIYVPNAFTPNGDGVNDAFRVYGEGILTTGMMVFNRWGEKVFESQNTTSGWDGFYQGELQHPGVFVYYIKVTLLNGREIEKKGSVTLLR